MAEVFAPTLAAARARIAAVRPVACARRRNAIDGAANGLSPYITDGLVAPAEVLAELQAGVAAIDEAVRPRHAAGMPHHPVRMWLAVDEVPAG
jgi:putative NIF3 family GTP cyclohydrolase 1 type 2